MKRLLVFVLLLGIGLLLLQWATGGEDFARSRAPAPGPATTPTPAVLPTPAGQPQQPTQPQGNQSMHLQGKGQDIGVTLHGGLTIPRTRDVRTGNRIDHIKVYELSFVDSELIDDGIQRLDDVTMQLFDRGEHAADLTAKTAFVELARDAAGLPSLREDKEVELRDAVLQTLPGARLAPLRLQIAVVKLRVRDDEIELHTPGDRDAVDLVVEGEHPGHLTGLGLQARLPKDSGGQLQRIDIEILHEPVLLTEGLDVRAQGRLHYVEEIGRGTALITLDDDVRLLLQAKSGIGAGKPGEIDVRGDHLAAWLSRQQLPTTAGGSPRSRVAWRLLRLDGGPATATTTGIDLRAAQLTVVPGLYGEPCQLTAAGGDTRLVQTSADGRTNAFRARRIHLLRPGADQGAIYRSFGFPTLALGALQQMQIGICEGDTEVLADGGIELHSQRGLWAFQPDPDDRDGVVMLRGQGAVRFAQGQGRHRLEARGDDGFVLTRRFLPAASADAVRTVLETLVLGADDPVSAQAYELQRGELHALGSGACRIERRQPDRKDAIATVDVHLRSQQPRIHGDFGGEFGTVQQIEALDATVVGDEVTALSLSGRSVLATREHGDETITAAAPHIWQEAPDVLRLDASAEVEARLHRTVRGNAAEDVELHGPLLRMHRLDARHVVLTGERQGEQTVHAGGTATPPGHAPVTFALDADWLQLVPFAVAPTALAAYGARLPRPFGFVFAQGMQQPWLFARGQVRFTASEQDQGSIAGNGHFLAVSQGSQSALLLGDDAGPTMASIERHEADGSHSLVRGPALRLWRDDGEHLEVSTTFPDSDRTFMPELELHQPDGRSTDLAHVWATCAGRIELRPERVLFGGPVHAHGLLADGSEDPQGMHIEAERLDMARGDRGEVTRVVADQGCTLRWNQLQARASHVELDALNQRCTVSDPVGVELRLPGYEGRALQAEINYVTYRLKLWTYSIQSSQEEGVVRKP